VVALNVLDVVKDLGALLIRPGIRWYKGIELDTEVVSEGSESLGGVDITGEDDVVSTVEEIEDLVGLQVLEV
jgi:hypothetical protein